MILYRTNLFHKCLPRPTTHHRQSQPRSILSLLCRVFEECVCAQNVSVVNEGVLGKGSIKKLVKVLSLTKPPSSEIGDGSTKSCINPILSCINPLLSDEKCDKNSA